MGNKIKHSFASSEIKDAVALTFWSQVNMYIWSLYTNNLNHVGEDGLVSFGVADYCRAPENREEYHLEMQRLQLPSDKDLLRQVIVSFALMHLKTQLLDGADLCLG